MTVPLVVGIGIGRIPGSFTHQTEGFFPQAGQLLQSVGNLFRTQQITAPVTAFEQHAVTLALQFSRDKCRIACGGDILMNLERRNAGSRSAL